MSETGILRISETEESTVSSEFIHLRLDAVPPLNIIGVYLEPTNTNDVAEATQKVLTDKVQRRVDMGENCVIVGDMNAAINCKKITAAAKQMLAWEATGKIIILNDRNQPTRAPYVETHQANCIDLGIITLGLKKSVRKWSLDTKRAWTPATAIRTGAWDTNGDKVYKRGTASDHKAIEIELAVDVISPKRSGNI